MDNCLLRLHLIDTIIFMNDSTAINLIIAKCVLKLGTLPELSIVIIIPLLIQILVNLMSKTRIELITLASSVSSGQKEK